jgi:endonuclease/exonuclease/phosphatase family metal-dependent hydrolase
VTGQTEIWVATYNIHKGVGADRRRDLARTAAVIAEIGADVIALQEADTRFGARTGLLDLDALRAATGLVAVPVEGAGVAHGWHGNLILVRDARVEAVHRVVLPGLEPRGALMADLVTGGQPVRVIAAHLGLLPQSRAAQVRVLLDRLDALDRRPTLLMGDLNEWRSAGSSLAPLGRIFTAAPPVRSFPARYPVLPLDRMMAGAGAELLDLGVHDTPLARRASDHLPIRGRLRVQIPMMF